MLYDQYSYQIYVPVNKIQIYLWIYLVIKIFRFFFFVPWPWVESYFNAFSTCNLIEANFPTASSEENCPFQFTLFQSSCYFISQNRHTREKAAEACEDLGGHLADITSEAEQNFLVDLMAKSGVGDAWFGLTYELNQKKWSDGSKLEEAQWYKLHLNSETSCIRIQKNGDWNDRKCKKEFRYICEREGRSMYMVHLNHWSHRLCLCLFVCQSTLSIVCLPVYPLPCSSRYGTETCLGGRELGRSSWPTFESDPVSQGSSICQCLNALWLQDLVKWTHDQSVTHCWIQRSHRGHAGSKRGQFA